MSIPRHHSEWLSLVEVSGPFLSMPVLMRVFPQGLEAHDPERFRLLRLAYEEWEENTQAGPRTNPAIHANWIRFILRNILEIPDNCMVWTDFLDNANPPENIRAIYNHPRTLTR